MNTLVGTGSLIRLIGRRDRIISPIWIAVLALIVVGIAASFARLYPTAEERQTFATALAAGPALTALIGPLYDTSIGGLAAWRTGEPLAVLAGLISLLTVIRHTRVEEETWRRELLGATVVGRQAQLTAALAAVCVANLVLAAVITIGLIRFGEPASGAAALGLSAAGAGMTFAAVAAIVAQLTSTAGAARGIAIAAVGAAFLLRLIGDSSGESGSLSWLSWLSPTGWASRTRPFAGEQWWVFGLFVGLSAVLFSVAYVLSVRRDIGAGFLPQRIGPADASCWLRGPLGLAWRLQRGTLLGWTAGFVAVGITYGSAANAMAGFLETSPQLQELIARIGGQAGIIDAFISAVMILGALAASGFAIQTALRLRSEEDSQRLEPVLATSVSRLQWAGSQVAMAVIFPAVIMMALGLGAGVTYGLTTGDIWREVPRTLAAALVQLPAIWVLGGLAVALFGLLPRYTGLSWAVLVACFLVGQLGQILQLSHWLIDLSPFTHVPLVLVGSSSLTPLLWLFVAAATLTVAGLFGFRRRDIARV